MGTGTGRWMRQYRTDGGSSRRLGMLPVVAALMVNMLLPLLASCGGSGDSSPTAPDSEPPPESPTGNDPPQAANDSASTPRGVSVMVHVLTNDTDPEGDELQLEIGRASCR